MTYDDWLQMTDAERASAHAGWNTYAREYMWVPAMAAARLAMISEIAVLDTSVGVYHGGEYLLHMGVHPDDIEKCPPFPSQTFEGFRVAWLAEDEPPRDRTQHPLFGRWQSRGDGGAFDIRVGVDDDGHLAVECSRADDGQPLAAEMPLCHRNSIQFHATCDGVTQRHDLMFEDDPAHPNRVRHEIATYQYGHRPD